MFFVGRSEKTYPGSNKWLIDACREAGFTPRILQDAEREPAVISFVAAGLGVALLPEQIKRLPHEGVIFRPLRRRLTAESWAVWKQVDLDRSADCEASGEPPFRWRATKSPLARRDIDPAFGGVRAIRSRGPN